MSSYVDRKYIYQIKGRKLHLWKMTDYGSQIPDTQGRLRTARENIIYPDEAITDGLRIEYSAIIKPFVTQDPEVTLGASLTEVAKPVESSHVNLNRMLALAAVDYVRAMMSERTGQLDMKEYYMKQFFKKVSDNDSNKRKIRFTFTSRPYGVR